MRGWWKLPIYYWRYRRTLSRGEQPKASSINADKELEEFLAENGLYPLYVELCPNPCGCVTLRTRGEVVDRWMTSNMGMVVKYK